MTNLGLKNSVLITNTRHLCRLVLIPFVCFLAACSNDISDLTTFVEKAKAIKSSQITPLPEIVPHETFNYQASQLRNPFEPFAATRPRPIGQKAGSTGKGPKPIPGRPRETLEAFSLDTLRMVGTLEQGEGQWALIKASDGTIHRVTPGNYLGQNHGKIVTITENKIELTEIAPDGLGDWMERPATMALSE